MRSKGQPKKADEHVKPTRKRLSLHPLKPEDALRHALTAGKVTNPKKTAK